MAATADKARFYLEQSIPDLQEFERKKIFSREEVTSITKKRSDFEYKVNARGAKPVDFLRYVDFEINLEQLRSKKAKRLGVKSSKQTGQKRALFILDRATKKFHGSLGLWARYLEVATKQKASGKIAEILTNLVRLHPTKPEVWTYAADHATNEHGDMTEARSYLQRGLRFCKNSEDLWLSYARLELSYIAKILARQQILGLGGSNTDGASSESLNNPDADMIALPEITQKDIDPSLRANNEGDKDALQVLQATPALTGAIPMAIFDAATRHFDDVQFFGRFYNLVFEFDSIQCSVQILQQILNHLTKIDRTSPITLDCWIRQPLLGASGVKSEFLPALSIAFSRLKTSLDEHPTTTLVQSTVSWITSYLKPDLDESIKSILRAFLLRTLTSYKSIANEKTDTSGTESAAMLELASQDAKDEVATLLPWALGLWPSNERLMRLRDASTVLL